MNILETVDSLEKLLDLDEPWELIVDDPTGSLTVQAERAWK